MVDPSKNVDPTSSTSGIRKTQNAGPTNEITITGITASDIPEITRLAEKVALKNQGNPSGDGFLVSGYSRDTYLKYLNTQDATYLAARNASNDIVGFVLLFDEQMVDASDPTQELNDMSIRSVKDQNSPKTRAAIIKQVAVDPDAAGIGVGSRLYDQTKIDARKSGIDVLLAAVVDDSKLESTEFDKGQRLPGNKRSQNFHAKNGFEVVADGFLYTAEISGKMPEIHCRDMYACRLNDDVNLSPLEIPADNQVSKYK